MKILAVCGMGFGSSMILKINILSVLKELKITGVEVEHCDLTTAQTQNPDLIVCMKDLAVVFEGRKVIALTNIMNKAELKKRLLEYLPQSNEKTAE
ncbi:MAG: PTS sugar transporter subunit IIB [Thermoguttaceae bacterium]|nr:PTS sugar transporter subunit IIB [Thermoguttaceae bacterium]